MWVGKRVWYALLLSICSVTYGADNTGDSAFDNVMRNSDVAALKLLAAQYERGEGVVQNFEKSNALYCRAAARGDTEAMIQLGLIYTNGRAVPTDEGIAALLFDKAAQLGNARAQQLLDYVPRNPVSRLPACMDFPVSVTASSRVNPQIAMLVQTLAPQYSIDPDLALAVIATESDFRADAVSNKNAQGLMQLIPATAQRFGVKKIQDPEDNIKGGLAYLRWLLSYFQGDIALVAAAYNAGEDTVVKYHGVPPYVETRNYVQRIMQLYKKPTHPYVPGIATPVRW